MVRLALLDFKLFATLKDKFRRIKVENVLQCWSRKGVAAHWKGVSEGLINILDVCISHKCV